MNEEDYVLVDDNGVMVPAASEGSYLYAVEHTDEVVLVDGGAWYAEGMAETRDALSQYRARSTLDSETTVQTTVEDDESSVEDEPTAADEDDDDGGMLEDGPYFSREYTAEEEEEWTLDCIVNRRNFDGVQHYLCQWLFYREMTWEPRSFLEEQGYVKLLEAYDATHPSYQKSARSPPKKHKEAKAKKAEQFSDIVSRSPVLVALPHFMGKIIATARSDNYGVTRMALVQNIALERAFLEKWAEKDDVFPAVLFHGTRAENIPSICAKGLLVPGQHNVRVENGSVHGIGIYAAKSPGMSVYYARNHPRNNQCYMLVCAGLIGPQYATSVSDLSSFCVFFDESLIVPIAVLELQQGFDGEPKFHKSVADLMDDKDSRKLKGAPPIANNFPASIQLTAVVGQHRQEKAYTKRMIRQAKRSVKELYQAGVLRGKKQA